MGSDTVKQFVCFFEVLSMFGVELIASGLVCASVCAESHEK